VDADEGGLSLETLARLCGLTLRAPDPVAGSGRVRGLALFDPESQDDIAGEVLAAPGHDLRGSAGDAILTRAARGRVIALLVSETQATDGSGRNFTVPMLTCPPGTPWAELVGRVRAVLATSDPDSTTGSLELPHRDLVLLANTVAERVGGSITIFSRQQEVIASSRVRPDDDPLRRQAVLDQHGPRWYREHLRTKGVYARLWSGDEVIDVPAVPEKQVSRRLAVAVRAGDEILGSLWAAEGSSQLAPDATDTLRQAAHAAAVRLLELHEQGRAARRADEEAARTVMAGRGGVEAACTQIGADAGLMCSVIALEPTHDTGISARRLCEAAALHSAAFRWTAAAVPRGERRTDLLVCNLADTSLAPVHRMMETFARDCEHTLLGSLRIGIGPVVPLDQAAQAAVTADLVLQALRRRAASGVATGEEMWASVGLIRLSARIQEHSLPSQPLQRLQDADAKHRSDLVSTLEAYLECLGDVAVAGKRLNVHTNTVRYRLRRIKEVGGLDLDDPDQRLLIWLQLRTGLGQRSTPGAKSN
jgi:PucR C-terminal helix-turn-helix domain